MREASVYSEVLRTELSQVNHVLHPKLSHDSKPLFLFVLQNYFKIGPNKQKKQLQFRDQRYFLPRKRSLKTFSSFMSMLPDPSVSNKSKASLISCFCSSVSSGFKPLFFRWAVLKPGFL